MSKKNIVATNACISSRVGKILSDRGVSLESLRNSSAEEILSIKGIGSVALVEIQQYFTNPTVGKYDSTNKLNNRTIYNSFITEIAETVLMDNTVEDDLRKSLATIALDSLVLRRDMGIQTLPAMEVNEGEFEKSISLYPVLLRKQLWGYRRAAIRSALISTLVSQKVNTKRFSFRLGKVVEAVFDTILAIGKNEVTLGQLVHRVSPIVKVKEYVTKEGNLRKSSHWLNDEFAAQLISELAELDYVNLSISEKTHKISVHDNVLAKLDVEELKEMSRVAKYINRKTLVTSGDLTIGKKMISQSSWWYKTPDLVDDQIEFANIMQFTKVGFVADAEDKVEAAYLEHLQISKSDLGIAKNSWIAAHIEEFKEQIAASHKAGGHYVYGKFDSALRWYYQSELGQVQTSKFMRDLLVFPGMDKPVKYDFRNNVIQMYALLTGIKDLGKFVGLTDDSEQVGDLRVMLAGRMNEILDVDTFGKENTKPLFMIWAYNAGRKTLMNGTGKQTVDFFTHETGWIEKTPGLMSVSGVEASRADEVWSAWNSILNELVPGVVAIKMLFRKLFKANPISEASWTLPDGAIAQYASVTTINEPLHWVDSNYKQHTHTHYRKHIEVGEKNTGGLPRIIHSFDAYVMRQLVIRARALGISIIPNHDSFIFDECHKATVFSLVDTIFAELLDSDALGNVVKELNVNGVDLTLETADGKVVTATSFGDTLTKQDLELGTPMAVESM